MLDYSLGCLHRAVAGQMEPAVTNTAVNTSNTTVTDNLCLPGGPGGVSAAQDSRGSESRECRVRAQPAVSGHADRSLHTKLPSLSPNSLRISSCLHKEVEIVGYSKNFLLSQLFFVAPTFCFLIQIERLRRSVTRIDRRNDLT